MLRKISLKYEPNPALIFARIAHIPGAVWLDSGRPKSDMGRYDIMSASPRELLTPDNKPESVSPFEYVEFTRAKLPQISEQTSPFTVGLIGYFSYETGLPATTKPKIIQTPEFIWGCYLQSLVIDHEQQTSTFYYWQDEDVSGDDDLLDLLTQDDAENGVDPHFQVREILSLTGREAYGKNFSKILDNIRSGNTYQVNYTQAHLAKYEGNTFTAYLALRDRLPSPYSGYLNFGETKILSFSPEQFVQKIGHKAYTRPIKGTRPRHSDSTIDALNRKELEDSEKDKAENLMIVDLLRNDLSKKALPRSVQVEKLFELQSFANVHHLVSTIACRLDSHTSAMAVLEGAWPGGSITGAPKKRSMTIIDKLEPHQRGIYCGSIGYLSTQGDMDTNLCIRTISCDARAMACWAGGGIVADSDVDLEYFEALGKIETLLEGLAQFQHSVLTQRLIQNSPGNKREMKTIMVKKILADGSPCKKCGEVLAKLESSGLIDLIDEVIVADERDPSSAGMQLAKELNVERAPFFVVYRDGDEPEVHTIYIKFAKEVLEPMRAS
ncbi:aminodeoxychorismate synthase component I [Halioxenophilus aromaticivorans]|uniref:aminodeoxychorismate synthase n=1 Tax=Halioxenophilus aromaticivorans TaxID=1306992 RepID=A0AAV3UA17_9ALTE